MISAEVFDDFAQEPDHNIYTWVLDITSYLGYRRNFMNEYYRLLVKPIYETNPTLCVEFLKDALRRHLPVLLDPTLEISVNPRWPLLVKKRVYLQACVIFRFWLGLEPFSLLGVTLESIESVEKRCMDITVEKINKERRELYGKYAR